MAASAIAMVRSGDQDVEVERPGCCGQVTRTLRLATGTLRSGTLDVRIHDLEVRVTGRERAVRGSTPEGAQPGGDRGDQESDVVTSICHPSRDGRPSLGGRSLNPRGWMFIHRGMDAETQRDGRRTSRGRSFNPRDMGVDHGADERASQLGCASIVQRIHVGLFKLVVDPELDGRVTGDRSTANRRVMRTGRKEGVRESGAPRWS